MIKLTNKQCEKINIAREDALEKIDIFKSGVEYPYYFCRIRPKCERTNWLHLLKQKINEYPGTSETLSTLNFNNKSELKDCFLKYLADIERVMVDENGTGVDGVRLIIEKYGKELLKILKIDGNEID